MAGTQVEITEMDPTATSDTLLGRVIDRYRVIEKLGQGGMGAVYAVEHVMLKKRMAMKLLRAEFSSNQELVTRFQNEAIAAGRIGQENIVTVSDFGRTPEGLVYFVMEELQGRSLWETLKSEGGLPVARTVGIALQVCRALEAAHQAGIIHRDLKPENIYLVPREGAPDFVKVLDFGLSKMAEPEANAARLTRAGVIMGTPEYMSPEQASGAHVDTRADIYSLGVLLFETLTGELPFKGDTPVQILLQQRVTPPPLLSHARPDVPFPNALEALVNKALAKDPDQRPQSMADCLRQLQACAESWGRPTSPPSDPNARPSAPPIQLTAPPPKPPIQLVAARSTPAKPPPQQRAEDAERALDLTGASLGPKRSGTRLAVILLIIVVGGGLGALAITHGSSTAEKSPPTPQPTPVAVTAPPLAPPPTLQLPPPPAVQPARPSHPRRASARPAAAPAEGSDEYEKMDDLKPAY